MTVSPDSASLSASTHARHTLESGPPYSLDAVLHVSRYRWTIERLARKGMQAVDLGCGTGYGVRMLAEVCDRVVGVDLDPGVGRLGQAFGLPNADFVCDDATSPDFVSRMPISGVDLVLSMETIEHIEDYFAYLENAVGLLAKDGTMVVATPNRTMTYERYPNRRHMDASHVQEFTLVALDRTLRHYFETVEIFYQYLPGYWSGKALVSKSADSKTALGWRLGGWIPSKLKGLRHRIVRRMTRNTSSPAAVTYSLSDVEFVAVADAGELTSEAFGLLAICRSVRKLTP